MDLRKEEFQAFPSSSCYTWNGKRIGKFERFIASCWNRENEFNFNFRSPVNVSQCIHFPEYKWHQTVTYPVNRFHFVGVPTWILSLKNIPNFIPELKRLAISALLEACQKFKNIKNSLEDTFKILHIRFWLLNQSSSILWGMYTWIPWGVFKNLARFHFCSRSKLSLRPWKNILAKNSCFPEQAQMLKRRNSRR